MKFVKKNPLYLFIFGIMLLGCYKLLDSKANTNEQTRTQTLGVLATQTNIEAEDCIVVSEHALPNTPGRIYVLKTESHAEIWHTCAITQSENGEIGAAKGQELSEKQKLNLLNTGVAPKGWEVVYVDEEGNPIYAEKQKHAQKVVNANMRSRDTDSWGDQIEW